MWFDVGIIVVIYTYGHDSFICIITIFVIMVKATLYYFNVLLGVIKANLVKFDM